MKKLLALLAVVLCVVSCQTEPEGLDVNVGGEIDAIVNVTIPEVETRAAGGNDSALGAFANVDFSKYTIRYILQVYYKGEPSQERLVKYSDDKSVAFDVRLVPGRDYNFVVWADIVADSNYADNQWSNDDGLHYNTTDLHNITLKQTWVAMDETRDAFTATVAVNNYSSASNITVKLQRPFAKLRVVTTDMVALSNIGIEPAKATVEYTVKHYNAFNAFEGMVINDSKNRDIKHEKFVIASYGDNTDKEMVLFTDYFFAAETDLVNEPDLVKFNLTVMEANGTPIGEIVAFNTDIPVNANYLTTIKGNILTDGKNFEVKIDDAFAGENKWPNTPAGELVAAAMFGGEVTLTEDVVLTEPLNVTSELTINLNGKTITTTEEQAGRHHYAILNNGTLSLLSLEGNGEIIARGVKNFGTMTVDGNLTIKNVDSNGGAAIWNEGELTINNGTFISSEGATAGSYGAALNTRAGGKAVVNGGTFEAYSQLTYAVVNEGETVIYNATVKGKHGAVAGAETNDKTTIYGGSFELMENPGVSDHCTYYVSAIYGGTFSLGNNTDSGAQVFCESTIAAGYKAIEKDGKFVVVPEDVDNVVANKAELKAALEAVAAGTTDVVIDANGANIGDLNYGLKTALVPAGRTVTIRNANVVGKSYGNGVDGTVIFDGCTFNNSGAYSIHFDNGNGDVIFKNCKLYGWNSFGSSLNSVSFENCTLDGNGTYALIRSYVALTLTNCVINTSNANHTDAYSEGVEAVAPATLTENNVTYVVENPEALENAINAGVDNISVKGEIDLANVVLSGYNGTIIGADDTAAINTRNFTPSADEAYQLRSTNLTFKNIDVKLPTGGDWLKSGFVGTGTIVFDECNFEGQATLNGSATWIFNDCTFVSTESGKYASFVYGATKATFNRCSFSGVDRAAKVYGTGGTLNVEYNTCEFTSSSLNKSGVEIDASYATTTVALNECTQTAMAGLFALEGSKGTVLVDGYTWITEGLVKKDNEYKVTSAAGLNYFSNKTVENGTVIKLAADIDFEGAEFKAIAAGYSKSLTFDGQNHTIKNVKIVTCSHNTVGSAGLFFCYPGGTLNVSNLEVENATSEGATYAGVITGYTQGFATLTNITVKDCNVSGVKKIGGLVGFIEASTSNFLAENCNVINTTVTATEKQAGTIIGYNAKPATLKNCTVENSTATAPAYCDGGVRCTDPAQAELTIE